MGRSLQRTVEAYNQLVGTLESRVLVQARRMSDLDLVESDLVAPPPVETAPRVLTAAELIEHVTAADARAELDLAPRGTGAGSDESASA
jgi:DNA recombination protein RmuC